MNPLNFKPSLNFEPPSDFVSEDASKKTSWKKIFGIGCGVIFLLIAIAVGAGAFKAASCCGDVTNLAQKGHAVSSNVVSFASLVQQGKWEQAHAQFSPEYAKTTDLTAFKAMFEPHRELLLASAPMIMNLEPQMVPGTEKSSEALAKIQRYNVMVRFFSPTSPHALYMAVTASAPAEVEQGQEVKTQIEHVGTQLRRVDLQQEPPVIATQIFYNDLQLKGAQGVYSRLSQAYQQRTDPKAFEAFVREHPDLTQDLAPAIAGLTYTSGANVARGQASVVLRLQPKQGDALYRFDLVRGFPSWQIDGIEALSTPAPSQPAPSKEPAKSKSDAQK